MAVAESSPCTVAASPNLNAFRSKTRVGRRNAVPEIFSDDGKTAGSAVLQELEDKLKDMETVPSTASASAASESEASHESKLAVTWPDSRDHEALQAPLYGSEPRVLVCLCTSAEKQRL